MLSADEEGQPRRQFTRAAKVVIFSNAGSISGDTTPLNQLTDTTLSLPQKAQLTSDGRCYVLDSNGVVIFRGATTTPAFVCEITTDVAGPRDMLVME